jgi:hypothetical protein
MRSKQDKATAAESRQAGWSSEIAQSSVGGVRHFAEGRPDPDYFRRGDYK